MGREEASQQPTENAESRVRISVYVESQNKGVLKPDRVAKRPRAAGRSELLAYARELRESHDKAPKKYWRWMLLHPKKKTWKYKAETGRRRKCTSDLCGKLRKILKEFFLCG
uniref:Uncharacterized protein n=1 Tax=Kalanchoe fedtschenkoi TaxID=63787 RepID=A0A7N0U8A1_KALFE